MRHRTERRNETFGDCLANLSSRFVTISGGSRNLRRLKRLDRAWITLRRRRGFRLTERGFDVSLDDAPAWSTALHRS
jgi:hypothetical protein